MACKASFLAKSSGKLRFLLEGMWTLAIQMFYLFSRFGAQIPLGPNQPSKVFIFTFCYLRIGLRITAD